MTKKQIQKKKEKYVQVCPQCKSINISQDKSTMQQLGELPIRYICNNCGHSGFSFPEVLESEVEKFEKDIRHSGLIDTKKDKTPLLDDSYGKFEVRFLWKIFSPIILFLGIILLFYKILTGIIFLLVGLVMGYITYFKKRKLRDD